MTPKVEWITQEKLRQNPDKSICIFGFQFCIYGFIVRIGVYY